MKYYSEDLKKMFDSAEACEAAEKEHAEKLKVREEEKNKLAIARKADSDKVIEKLKAIQTARKAYEEELNEFCKKYGTFHATFRNSKELPSVFDLFDDFFSLF